jgi:hypothetical protein
MVVLDGRLSVSTAGGAVTAGPGEVVHMPKGEAVTIRSHEDGAVTAYVTYPHWRARRRRSCGEGVTAENVRSAISAECSRDRRFGALTMSTNNKQLISVYGATSKQGRSVAVTLLESDRFRVRAITRNRDSKEARSLELLGAEIATVPAGLGHHEELVTAFTGADGVFLMTPQINPQDDVEFAWASN